jgi:cell division septation protein DedD
MRSNALVVTVAVALVGAGTLTAHAAWLVPGPVGLKIRTVQMPRGVTPSVAEQDRRAIVSWSAQHIAPGTAMQRYVITAHSVDRPPLADVVHTVVATGADARSTVFAAGEVAGGTWYWTLVPTFESWVDKESKRSGTLGFPAAPDDVSRIAAPSTAPSPTGTPTASPAPSVAPPTTPPVPITTPADSPDTPSIEPTVADQGIE